MITTIPRRRDLASGAQQWVEMKRTRDGFWREATKCGDLGEKGKSLIL